MGKTMSAGERTKIFCVGRNKTGTTSLAKALRGLGFSVGSQRDGERLMGDWARRDFRRICDLAGTADAFQDNPFSLPYTFQALDAAWPGSKFILTRRRSAGEWYESLTSFHTKIVGKGRLPTAADLRAHSYCSPGWLWQMHEFVYGIDETTLYDREIYTRHYEFHNSLVIDYFRHRPGRLLVLTLGEKSSMAELCEFLGIPFTGQTMPHENRSR